jgi:hypothetical protein
MVARLRAVGQVVVVGWGLVVVGTQGGPVARPGVVELSAVLTGRSTAPVPFDWLLLDIVSGAGLGTYLGIVGSVALAVGSAIRRSGGRAPRLRPWARRGTAARWMALVAGVCGIGIAVAPAGSLAAGGGAHHCDPPTLTGLPMPDLPVAGTGPGALVRSVRGRSALVRPGDTLWWIAAGRLPERATDARIAMAVDRWYDRNRSVLGPDPDLIFPGTRLEQPGGTR